MNGKGLHSLRSSNMDQAINISKASGVCNTFYVFLSAAKASLLPFLTLFFRLVGLNAFDTGIIMAAKTLIGFVFAPLWARCAVAYNKRRLVLVFSLLMMSVMYLSFIGVYYKVGNPLVCQQTGKADGHLGGNSSAATVGNGGVEGGVNTTVGTKPGLSVEHPGPTGNASSSSPSPETSESADGSTTGDDTLSSENTPSQSDNSTETLDDENGASQSGVSETPEPDIGGSNKGPEDDAGGAQPVSPTKDQRNAAGDEDRTEEDAAAARKILEQVKSLIKPKGFTLEDLNAFSNADLLILFHKLFPDMGLTDAAIQQIKDAYASTTANSKSDHARHARNLNFVFLNKLKEAAGRVAATVEEQKLLLFLVILCIMVFGEFFSSPVEKIADDAWFDFLERIDDMEKYGRQRYWGSFAYAIIPIAVGIAVDFTPCQLVLNLHHFLIHFYVFGIFMVITLGIAFYYPMPPPVKQKYTSKVCKALRLICCDFRGFLFTVTLLIAGMLYASFNNFLFWHLLDMGSQEVTMGLCVSIGAFAETPMLVFSGKLVRKLGNGWVVALSLLVLSLRLLFYGFLWTPWAVLPAEITNAFTHTALWYAVLSYDEFSQGSAIDRSIRSILSSFYFGLGFCVGSLLSGLVFHIYGAHILYWGASIISGAWCILYSLLQFCLPKKEKIRYIKLLRKDDDESSEGEDDWLELALKEQ